MAGVRTGPAESLGIAIEVIDRLRYPSCRKTLKTILDDLEIPEDRLDSAVEMLRTAYGRM